MITTKFEGLGDLTKRVKNWVDLNMSVEVTERAIAHWLENKIDELTEDIEDSFDRDYEGLKQIVAEYEYKDNGDTQHY